MGLMNNPIFREDLIAAGEKYSKNCPSKKNEKYDETKKAIVDTSVSGENTGILDNMPMCNYDKGRDSDDYFKNFSNDSATDLEGCCIQEKSDTMHCPAGYDTGIDFENKDRQYNICNRYDIKEFNKVPNGLIKFCMYIFISLVIMLIITFVGCSYEFWLEYGTNINCLYYQSKCDNRSKYDDGKASMIDFLFPNALNFFPYQPCLPCDKFPEGTNPSRNYKQSGGKADGNGKINEFVSNFTVNYINNKKCITVNDEESKCNRPFPYNIPDFVANSPSNYIKTIFKTVGFFYAIPMLILRIVFNFVLSGISTAYQKYVSNSGIAKALCFLFLSGLLAPTLGMLGIQIPAITIFSNPMSFFGILISISEFIGLFGFLITWVVVIGSSWSPAFVQMLSSRKVRDAINDHLSKAGNNYSQSTKIIRNIISKFYPNESTSIDDSENYIMKYYSLFTWKHWFLLRPHIEKNRWGKFVLSLLCNIFILPLCYLILIISVIAISSIMYSISATLFAIMTFFKLFFYPISNKLEFYNVVKSHSTY